MQRRARLVGLWLSGALAAQSPAPPAAAVPPGAVVDAPFTDLRWQSRRLHELGATTATVLYFATIECPIVQRQLPRLGELAREFEPRGVVVLVVNVGPGDGLVDAAGQVATAAPAAVFAKDFDLALARACGVDRTGTAVVLDRDRRLCYRGRVDDQHGYTGARPEASRHDLREALADVLAGRPVALPATEVSGCRITPPAAPAPGPAPTFARDVLPILQRHCQECHRPGGEAPFPLLDEAQAKKHAAMLAEVVAQGRMPPWYGAGARDVFANHRGLAAGERETVARWVEAGLPGGDPADLPPPRPLPTSAWRIGEPDLVVEVKAPVRLPADGTVPYKYFVLPHRFERDTWVEAVEIRPTNARVLHHCNLARVRLGEAFSQDGFVTGYVPGGDPMVMEPGTAVRIPAGSALALQAHYVTTGEPEIDRLRVGFRFPRVVVQKEMQVAIVANQRFEIPPGARAHPVRATRKVPVDAEGIGMFVHMHLRGRDMVVTATAPGGDPERLLVVPNYNFDWQQSYRWAPGSRTFAGGTRFEALAHFDNSAWNPFNPDPAAVVRFGLETTDEMMYLFVFWVAREQALGLHVDPRTGHERPAPDPR
ncbi:MAG: redoxin family protein [Planctomycetes bacterium]|nr:redoxin family protein [Planctomycetota bacterium]